MKCHVSGLGYSRTAVDSSTCCSPFLKTKMFAVVQNSYTWRLSETVAIIESGKMQHHLNMDVIVHFLRQVSPGRIIAFSKLHKRTDTASLDPMSESMGGGSFWRYSIIRQALLNLHSDMSNCFCIIHLVSPFFVLFTSTQSGNRGYNYSLFCLQHII